MKAEYKRDLQNNYLILEAEQGDTADDYQIRMAEQNRISGLLTYHSSKRDGKLFLHYEITSKQQLAGLYDKGPINYRDIIFLLTSLAETLEDMQKYLLNPALLVFDPQYIYVSADRKKYFLCYLPGKSSLFPIELLAEFILKKLNHTDWKAIELGYSFYQNVSAENFSLQKTIKELLTESGKEEQQKRADLSRQEASGAEPRQQETGGVKPQRIRRMQDERNCTEQPGQEKMHGKEIADSSPQEYRRRTADSRENYADDFEAEDKRRNTKAKNDGVADRLFQAVHPAVLLSGLILLAVLEMAFYFGIINITEAGGSFFLLIAVETLINKWWRLSKQKKRKYQETLEEEDEAYEALREEMYQNQEIWQNNQSNEMRGSKGQGYRLQTEQRREDEMQRYNPQAERTQIEETRCLAEYPVKETARFICRASDQAGGKYSDIEVGTEPVYVGKLWEESDVILESPTISRVHARLECRDDGCYVKDLNSRNGTFVNEKRLKPQEQCEIHAGDKLRFAEIEYCVISTGEGDG